jgi:16S rRNA (guanine527-N7)-methyltransferase
MAEPPSAPAERLRAGLAALGLALPEATQARLLAYTALLAKWNRVYNLTAVGDPAEMVARHLLDSLAVAPYLHGSRVLDVGTGAGLPGIPLALARPELHFALLDSAAKKLRFVVQATAELGLANVETVHARVEAYRPERPFDTVISRAYAALGDFVASAGALCAPDGRLLAMKGAYPQAELAALPGGWMVAEAHRLQVPGLDAERHLVCIMRGQP